jgi:hypothetical protein
MSDETQSIGHNYQAHIELLREVGDLSADRFFDVVRAARLDAGDEAVWPALLRQALHAVALCRRAAEIAARR